jgi:hypothetical protein
MGDQPIARSLPAHRPTETQNKCTQTSMPQVVFEPTIPLFEQAKTVHTLDCVATVISVFSYRLHIYSVNLYSFILGSCIICITISNLIPFFIFF